MKGAKMREVVEEIIKQTKIVITCDFCGAKDLSYNGRCDLCKKDFCDKCGHYYSEEGDGWCGDSWDPDFCICPDCKETFEPAWDWARGNAGRHDDIKEVTLCELVRRRDEEKEKK